MSETFRIGMVGDLLINRDEPLSAFASSRELFNQFDVLFGNLEGPYSDKPVPPLGIPVGLQPPAGNIHAFGALGFNVMSLANNHIIDAGQKAMLENRRILEAEGVACCGAGANLTEARAPAIVERNGTKMAFLAYASVFPIGYEATNETPGLAPLRAYDHWRPYMDNYYVPGAAPHCETILHATDRHNLCQDIAAARKRADLVFTGFHWGDYLRPCHVTAHEKDTARLCIDEGADMVIGHHQHSIRGMEWYRGKPVIYGLGHYVFELPMEQFLGERLESVVAEYKTGGDYAVFPREGWPLLPLHEDTRMTIIAVASVRDGAVADLGIIPAMLRPDGSADPVHVDSGEGRQVIDYFDRCNSTQDLNARLDLNGPEIGGFRVVLVRPGDADSLKDI